MSVIFNLVILTCSYDFDYFSEIVSAVVSLFSSMYVMKWKEFFPEKEFKEPPYFDGRSVCYPSSEILRDYLAWRQVDCEYSLFILLRISSTVIRLYEEMGFYDLLFLLASQRMNCIILTILCQYIDL